MSIEKHPAEIALALLRDFPEIDEARMAAEGSDRPQQFRKYARPIIDAYFAPLGQKLCRQATGAPEGAVGHFARAGASARDLGADEIATLGAHHVAAENSAAAEMITKSCIPSRESATRGGLQGISPDQFDPDTGMYRGSPVTQEQLEYLESVAGTLLPPARLHVHSA
jgi:hypothetical protein